MAKAALRTAMAIGNLRMALAYAREKNEEKRIAQVEARIRELGGKP